MKKELYTIVTFLFLIVSLIVASNLAYNYSLIKQNKDFYKQEQTINYDKLIKDLKDKKINSYSKNIIYPEYLEFKDIIYNLDQALKVFVYKFNYNDGKSKLYVIDTLKVTSLDSKDNKELGSLLYNLENKKGVVYDLGD